MFEKEHFIKELLHNLKKINIHTVLNFNILKLEHADENTALYLLVYYMVDFPSISMYDYVRVYVGKAKEVQKL
jgi:hypothetical protein